METICLEGKKNKNCKVFTTNVEDEAISMILSLLATSAFENVPVRIMPDTHLGKGIVIGFTAPITNMICPSHVGVDIGCMIDCYKTDTKINPSEYALIEHRIRKEIPFGIDINSKNQFDMKDFLKFMRTGFNRVRSLWPEMIDGMTDISEEGFSDLCQRIGMDEGKFYKSLLSVGGGNHFIEIGATEDGNYAFTIHCGSRNFGVKVCNYWEKIANKSAIDAAEYREGINRIKKNAANRTDIPRLIEEYRAELERKSPPTGYLNGENMRQYITDMAIAQLYAEYNHKLIGERIASILNHINGAKIVEHIVSIHNYIDYSDHIIRKGAIRSYEGEKMVLPFNMRDGIAICVGKSNADWNNSAPHGCGRIMSRSAAKNKLSLEEFQSQMKGIYSTSVGKGTIDEAPNAYKPMDEIIDAIAPTCTIIEFIKPIINLKSFESAND